MQAARVSGWGSPMCNLYSITTNQAAIIALFQVVDRYVGNGHKSPSRACSRSPP